MIDYNFQKKSIFLAICKKNKKKLLTAKKNIVYIKALSEWYSIGRLAEWLCRGLQILVYRFNSGTGLHQVLFRLSSVVEQSAVNRLFAGSSPAVGANKRKAFSNEKAFLFIARYARLKRRSWFGYQGLLCKPPIDDELVRRF